MKTERKEFMWAYLIHLGSNMWGDQYGGVKEKYHGDSVYRDHLLCDRETWEKVIDFLPTQGINTVLIDIGEAIKYQSHPELAVKGSWSPDEFRTELKRIRESGLEPIPKLNFSAGHDSWLQDYTKMLSTPKYYEVIKDLIDEVCALFDKPRLFHIGMDEEKSEFQNRRGISRVRNEVLWWKDFYYICDCIEKNGARPWVWSDYYWHYPDLFCKHMPKSVLQSNWYYNRIEPKENGVYANKSCQAYIDLNNMGYDQVLTGSTWRFYANIEQTVMLPIENDFSKEHLHGFIAAPWIFTTPYNYYGLLNDAARLGYARKWHEDKLNNLK